MVHVVRFFLSTTYSSGVKHWYLYTGTCIYIILVKEKAPNIRTCFHAYKYTCSTLNTYQNLFSNVHTKICYSKVLKYKLLSKQKKQKHHNLYKKKLQNCNFNVAHQGSITDWSFVSTYVTLKCYS